MPKPNIKSLLALAGTLLMAGLCAPTVSAQSPNIIWSQAQNSDRINAIIVSPSGNTVISGSSDRLINFWAASDGTLLRTLNSEAVAVHESAIESLSMSSDSTRLVSTSYKVAKLWNLSTGVPKNLIGHTDWVVGSSFSPNGAYIATASFDGTIRIWNGYNGTPLRVLQGSGQMRAVAFSPDGSLLAAAGGGGKEIQIYRTSDFVLIRNLVGHTEDVYDLAFSRDGTKLASGGYDQTARIWNVADGSPRFVFRGNNGNVYGVAFTPDSGYLAYTDGEGSTIKIYRASDGAFIRSFNQNTDNPQCLAFAPNGTLAYGLADKTVVFAKVDGSSGGGGGGGGGTGGGSGGLPAVGAGWRVVGKGDFDRDGKDDILWQNSNGTLAVWKMDGTTLLGSTLITHPYLGTYYRAVAVYDWDGDGNADIILQAQNGAIYVWYFNGLTLRSGALINVANPGPSWKLVGLSDFNGDGHVDLLWQSDAGALALWYLDENHVRSGASSVMAPSLGAYWRVLAVVGGGAGDETLLIRNVSGLMATWQISGTSLASGALLHNGTTAGSDWRVVLQDFLQ